VFGDGGCGESKSREDGSDGAADGDRLQRKLPKYWLLLAVCLP
jgi:hypothetical protein